MKNCDHELTLVIYIQTGICYVDKAVDTTYHDCVDWTDTEVWEEIDKIAGTNTRQAARRSMPDAAALIITVVIISCLCLGISIYSLKRPNSNYAKLRQNILALLALSYFVLAYAAGYLGSTTDITLESTWKPFTLCTDTFSYPYSSYYSLLISWMLSGLVVCITVFPSKMWCFQLISAEEDPNDESPLAASNHSISGDISLVDITVSAPNDNPIVYKNFSEEESKTEDGVTADEAT